MSMSLQQERPSPPAYAQLDHEHLHHARPQWHGPESLHLPAVPTHSPSQVHAPLPSIRSLALPDASAASAHGYRQRASVEPAPRAQFDQFDPAHWGSLPPLNSASLPRVPEGVPRASNEMDAGSPMDTASIASAPDEAGWPRETSVLSVDDPDVRLAAEALSGLGNPDFARSPASRSLALPRSPPTAEPEPLLSLITSNHPWLGGAIDGSISAYNATKGYSPRFVKYGAELIERNVGSPVVNTVSSVGRRTGVEQNLRRYLGEVHRRPSDMEQGAADAAPKRQRIMNPAADAMDNADSLPAYDDQRSPNYEESALVVMDDKDSASQDRRVNWSTQLIMTTSGLGVALSDTSLRSLKMCLGLLRAATKHIDVVMHALRLVLEEYESLRSRRQQDDAIEAGNMHVALPTRMDVDQEEQVRRIADRMKTLSSDIWTTLERVVRSVSNYTGSALPQNASQVVRGQLLSVPQRWQSAGRSSVVAEHAHRDGEQNGEEARGAQRMLAFAKEGLDMMGQITTVVDGTVQSAETWLGRIGRRPQDSPDAGSASREKTGAYIANGSYPLDAKK